ncbi:CCA tRNA nucleotidyltransferase [Shimia sp. CNT1-13L.2]|uniref:CCA tRNA nucleotidyltransferase n=1 Tax=Shimia sp. CNT1-13L.2 TaxID=2959663 RepID=UPI0034E959F6
MIRVSGSWLENEHTQAVCKMLTNAGYQALFVGGCVRNALIGAEVNDIDISTDALPKIVMELAAGAGLNAIPTGIEHGTITVVSGHVPHEITTFRKDVETDGRRAVVAFSKHVEDDAHRRDFTMNALYADASGIVFDPLGGLKDLDARKLRFIDDADQRIREDYLRILRFFRFHAWYGNPEEGMDAEALAAIAANVDGIDSLSKERVGAECVKLLSAKDPAPALAAMNASGALMRVIDGAEIKPIAPLVHFEELFGLEPDPMRRLAALGGENLGDGLRLSKKQQRLVGELREETGSARSLAELGYRFGESFAASVMVLRCALLEMPLDTSLLAEIQQGVAAVFPIKPKDLMPAYSGPTLGQKLKDLERRWIESNFKLDREALLEI